MQANNRIFDDFAKVLTSAAGAAQGVRDEIDAVVKNQMERLLKDMELVTRDEFDAVMAMAVRAREENETLEARLAGLEDTIASLLIDKKAENSDAK